MLNNLFSLIFNPNRFYGVGLTNPSYFFSLTCSAYAIRYTNVQTRVVDHVIRLSRLKPQQKLLNPGRGRFDGTYWNIPRRPSRSTWFPSGTLFKNKYDTSTYSTHSLTFTVVLTYDGRCFANFDFSIANDESRSVDCKLYCQTNGL